MQKNDFQESCKYKPKNVKLNIISNKARDYLVVKQANNVHTVPFSIHVLAFSFKLKSGIMQLFFDPKLIAMKTLWEARGGHIVTVKTTKEKFTEGAIEI